MIVFKGDLMQAKEDIIVHQVNCQGKMNSGVAKQIRSHFPEAYLIYSQIYNHLEKTEGTADALLGAVQLAESGDKEIANLFGQKNYGYDGQRYTDYEAMYTGLAYIRDYAIKNNKSVAIPYNMGCDRGGASWKVVSAMIDDLFTGRVKVSIYKLEG